MLYYAEVRNELRGYSLQNYFDMKSPLNSFFEKEMLFWLATPYSTFYCSEEISYGLKLKNYGLNQKAKKNILTASSLKLNHRIKNSP